MEDFYRDISSDVDVQFDTSEFQADHPSGIKKKIQTGKHLGMMKDEACGKIVEEFVGLKAKLYPLKRWRIRQNIKGIKE